MPDSTRYRVVDFIGGRILESREMMTLQNIAEGVDSGGNAVVHDLNAIYREGATFNVKAVVTAGTRTVTLSKVNNALPMMVFVHGRWEELRSADAPSVTLTSIQQTLYLNWALNVVTSTADPSLVDAATGQATANMGELSLAVSATDTSATALGGSQLAKNTSPIVLFNFVTAGSSLTVSALDNVQSPALASNTTSGLVKLTTGTSAGTAAASDDPRLADSRAPAIGSVVDASVRTPVSNSNTNTDGSAQYDLTTDAGGISADKIIWQTYKERVSDFLAWVRAQVSSLSSTITAHVGAALGSPSTHPMPTATQVGAAPLSHVGLPLGTIGSHPAAVNQDSGGFQVNQDGGTFASSSGDPAYGVFENGSYVAGLEHGGDVYTAVLAALVANPGGSPLHFTGPLHGLKSVAQVLVDHVNQNNGGTNPHGTTLATLGGTGLSISTTTATNTTGAFTNTMNWLILRFSPNGTNAIEVALGMGIVRDQGFVPLPSVSFDYTSFMASVSVGLGMGHGTTYNNIQVMTNIGSEPTEIGGGIPANGQVYVRATNNNGVAIPGELNTGNPMIGNVIAVAWRQGA